MAQSQTQQIYFGVGTVLPDMGSREQETQSASQQMELLSATKPSSFLSNVH